MKGPRRAQRPAAERGVPAGPGPPQRAYSPRVPTSPPAAGRFREGPDRAASGAAGRGRPLASGRLRAAAVARSALNINHLASRAKQKQSSGKIWPESHPFQAVAYRI